MAGASVKERTGEPLFEALNQQFIVKANCCLVCRYRRINNPRDDDEARLEEEETQPGQEIFYFWSVGQTLTGNFEDWWVEHNGRIVTRMDSFHSRGSALIFDSIVSLRYRITLLTNEQHQGQGFRPTPTSIRGK